MDGVEGFLGPSFPAGLILPAPQRDFNQDASPQDSGFMSEMEELRRKFLKRPGCPQFSTRSTSISHYGECVRRGPVCTPTPIPSSPPAGVQDSLRVWPEEGACVMAAAAASETGSQLRLGLCLGEGKEGRSFFLPVGTFVSLVS